jgi:hypothetical protein
LYTREKVAEGKNKNKRWRKMTEEARYQGRFAERT